MLGFGIEINLYFRKCYHFVYLNHNNALNYKSKSTTWKDFPGFSQQRDFIEGLKCKCFLPESLVFSLRNESTF